MQRCQVSVAAENTMRRGSDRAWPEALPDPGTGRTSNYVRFNRVSLLPTGSTAGRDNIRILNQVTSTMSIVDYEIDALTEPLPRQGADVIEDFAVPQTNQEHLRSIKRCAHCKQPLLIGGELGTQPYCCSRAYLSDAQRYIRRCMMKICHADAQKIRCQALLDVGESTMIMELRFTFQDGWVEQTYVTSDEYYDIVRRTVTKQDLKQWKIPFASLDKASFLVYPAQCRFTQLIYNECVATGVLTEPHTSDDINHPIQFAVREARYELEKHDHKPVSPQPHSRYCYS